MKSPSPSDLADAPLWENYVTAQASQAALGAIADDVLAIGVRVEATDVTLVVQRTDEVRRLEDVLDAWDIAEDLQDLVGPDVDVHLESHR